MALHLLSNVILHPLCHYGMMLLSDFIVSRVSYATLTDLDQSLVLKVYTKIQFLVARGTRSCIRLHGMGVLVRPESLDL